MIPKIQRLEFHISYSCLNQCIFCSEAVQLKKFENIFVKKELVLRVLDRYATQGIKHVSLTGGEPTLHPDFLEIIKKAKKLGLRTYVSSNGGLFASNSFCQKVLPYCDEISFSFHGDNAAMHNAHTQNPASFYRLKKALHNIEKMPFYPYVFINMVATARNIDSLVGMIKKVVQFKKVKQILISNLAPEGRAREAYKQLAVPLEDFTDKIDRIVCLAHQHAVVVRFFGLPLCALKFQPEISNDSHWSPRITLELWKNKSRTYLKKTTSLSPIRQRRHLRVCRFCGHRAVCAGVFKWQLRQCGTSAVKASQ